MISTMSTYSMTEFILSKNIVLHFKIFQKVTLLLFFFNLGYLRTPGTVLPAPGYPVLLILSNNILNN